MKPDEGRIKPITLATFLFCVVAVAASFIDSRGEASGGLQPPRVAWEATAPTISQGRASATEEGVTTLETDLLRLRFERKSGELQFTVLNREGRPGETIRVPTLSLDGLTQADYQPSGEPGRAFQNQSLKVELEVLGPRAVAVTWSGRDRSVRQFELRVVDNSSYYGGGERFHSVNQKGYVLPMTSIDRPEDKGTVSYKPVPFYMSSRGYGVWIDSYAPGSFDLNATDRFQCVIRYPENRLRMVFFAGPEMSEILKAFTELAGRPRVPPAWTFAPWKSRDVYRNREDVLQDVELYRRHDLPASVIVLDSPWETGYNNFVLNEVQFTDARGMFDRIEELGFYTCFWLTPFVNSRNITDMKGIEPGASSNYREASEKGYLVKQAGGGTMIREWWKGEGGLVDFTNPEAAAWWHSQVARTKQWGARAFKCDDGEGNFVGDAAFHDGTSAQKMKNRYAELYLKTMQEYVDQELGGDGVLLARPGFTGTQKYPFCWSGDNQADFSFANGLPTAILAGQTAGLSGIPLWGHDIAGYFGRPTKELFVRWTQFGAFTPLMQVHMTSNLGPWDFDEEALAVYRNFSKLHTGLFPYIYEAAHESARTGMPIIRAMALAAPADPEAPKHIYQYFFGPDFLVAPMYQGGTHRTVYLPEGEWVDYWSGEKYPGKQTVEVHAPLARMPLFVRAGAMIPMLPPDVDTLIRRHEKMSEAVVALDERRVVQVWPGVRGEFATWEGMRGRLDSGGGHGKVTIHSRERRPLEVRFMFREARKITWGAGTKGSCLYDDRQRATVCRVASFQGETVLSW